ncbi:hypothetical protein AGOR_G00037600 [Albula goreensis]|uniref:Uncharacterized protein n=1 Tax=Albula goreensis TaxID=1534307 RepID=A0A8T3DWL3_9TELE|nr:hypothetical protein AGOR_G00037600 [Albula goreensis]
MKTMGIRALSVCLLLLVTLNIGDSAPTTPAPAIPTTNTTTLMNFTTNATENPIPATPVAATEAPHATLMPKMSIGSPQPTTGLSSESPSQATMVLSTSPTPTTTAEAVPSNPEGPNKPYPSTGGSTPLLGSFTLLVGLLFSTLLLFLQP